MSEAPPGQALAARLRELRQTWHDLPVTQKHLAEALGTSTALVSSYESGVIPPEDRLKSYARFFATRRSMDGPKARLLPAADLTPAEERRREELIDELVHLREGALHRPTSQSPRSGALGGQFWFFPDGTPITILYTPFSQRQLGLKDGHASDSTPPIVKYATRSHPNYIASLRNADSDAVMELVGHIRAENPRSEVRWVAHDEIMSPDQLTGHLVLLGGGDAGLIAGGMDEGLVDWFVRRLDLPVGTRLPEGADEEFDLEFIVTTDEDGNPSFGGSRVETYRPRFLRDESNPDRPLVMLDGSPQLEYDLGLLVRQRNPLNLSAKITMCSGIFSRGTYGVVRATTDRHLRERNEQFLAREFATTEQFWMLVQIPVFRAETITPDLERPFLRLRSSR